MIKELIFLLFISVYAQNVKTYEGYKVLSANFNYDNEVSNFLKLSEVIGVDIWKINRTTVEFMVEPSMINIFNHYNPTVIIDDVQDEIEKNKRAGPVSNIFDDFPLYADVLTWLDEQVAAYPTFASKFTLGKTARGVDIIGLKLARNPEKKIFYIHCTIHAREWITTTTCLWIIDQLLNLDPERSQLLAEYQWFIVPVLNVDGYEYSHNTERLWRKNRQSNSGSTCIGTDLNRNYGNHWGGTGSSSNPCSDTYRGAAKYSSPEINAENAYLTPLWNDLAAFVDIHSYGGYFMSPWGWTTSEFPDDYDEMLRAMRSVVAAIRTVNQNLYTFGSSGSVLYPAAGGSDDDAYGTGGVIHSFTVEAAGNSFIAPVTSIPRIGAEIYKGIKELANIIPS